jgi:TonB family protein
MSLAGRVVGVAALWLGAVAALGAQEPAAPRRLPAEETGCDSTRPASSEPVYQADSVDRAARAPYVRVRELPFRMREVQTGRTMLQFVVDSDGRVERCSIALVEESSPEWTAAVLPELRRARFEPARKDGRKVRQLVYQVFTYHTDGRTAVSQ